MKAYITQNNLLNYRTAQCSQINRPTITGYPMRYKYPRMKSPAIMSLNNECGIDYEQIMYFVKKTLDAEHTLQKLRHDYIRVL